MHSPGPPPRFSPLSADTLRLELQGPIDGVIAMAELLSRAGLPGDAGACLRTLQDGAARALQVLSQAQALDDARRGTLVLEPRPFLIRSLIDDLQSKASILAEGSLLASFEGDGELGAVGDCPRLARVLEALTGAAAARRRRAPVEVSLSARAEDGRIRLHARVRDDGVRPLAADMNRLFTAEVGGIGAALAAALVQQMGGRLHADGNLGSGVTFAFEIELAQALLAEPAPPVAAAEGLTGRHVLIVDDNATNRLVAEAFCDMFGCTSDSACDGVEAVEAVRVRRYDAVLMDVKMPRMDGVDATRAIRFLSGPERDTPIIALTANADPLDVERYRAAGMLDVVEKPIKADRLAFALNAVFEPRAAEGVRAA